MPLLRFLKKHFCIIAILTIGFFLRFYLAWVDPFLHPWDERFHALVARNMMLHPFKPMLRAFPVTNDYDPNMWCCNHVWLHKQPLFMWQMALSMKIFGVSELAMRLPSVLMGTIAIGLLYRITLIFTKFNKSIALIAASLLAVSNFHIQMISGVHGMDHNDVALGFYVLASIWSYAEYIQKPKLHWILLIGLFAGCAILCKWLLGLLVFLGWGINIVMNLKKDSLLREVRGFVLSLVVCCIIFVPWQVYILHTFPNEAQHEFEFNRRHITEALEGHSGTIFYYFDNFPNLFGNYISILLLFGLILSFFTRYLNKKLLISQCIEILFVFCFFSFIVKTKVDTFFFFVVPLCLSFVAITLFHLFKVLKKYYLIIPIIIIVLYVSLNPFKIKEYLSTKNTERNNRIYNAEIYRTLKKSVPDSIKVVMNMNSFEDIDVMFYNNDITAYHWTLAPEDIAILKQKKIPIAVFESHGNYNLPEHILKYPYLFIIHKNLKDF